jgi:hypothetical protein
MLGADVCSLRVNVCHRLISGIAFDGCLLPECAMERTQDTAPLNGRWGRTTGALIDRIELTPNPNGNLGLDLYRDLAGILRLAANKNGPLTESDPFIEQVKAVARTRNHLDLLFRSLRINHRAK